MANRTEKEKFFAQLDDLDESTETESESEAEGRLLKQRSPKRQKLNAALDAKDGATTPDTSTRNMKHVPTTDAENSKQLHGSARSRTTKDKKGPTEIDKQKQQTKSSHNTLSRQTRIKQQSSAWEANSVKRLFEHLTFYFIPNDDVSKPRKLRIQSAISQGATWSRKLEPGVTHVIVDPDIPASAVANYIKEITSLSGIAFVKMNWLVESLSHRSVRNPLDSRFQLKGGNTVLATFLKHSLPASAPKEALLTRLPANTNLAGINTFNADKTNELDQIVQSMKTATDLPFDEELDIDDFLSFSSGGEQGEGASGKTQKANSFKHRTLDDRPKELENSPTGNFRNAGFQCMHSNSSNQAPSPNDRTISILQQMATYYDRTGDNWRTLAYRRAIAALRKHDTHVKTAAQARAIHGIGTRLADKIEEIVTTDRLKRLDAVLSDPDDEVLQLFMGIYGVGLRQARAWMEQGYRTLDDLVQNARLSLNQKIGIDHHADFAQRIPRSEVKQHGDIVAQALKVANRDLQSIIGGSYRRGNPDSGDIDVIITHPTATLQQLQSWIFDIIVPRLFKIGFMKCALATSRPAASTPQRSKQSHQPINPNPTNTDPSTATNPTSSGTKFLGASQLPASPSTPSPPWRRIDLLLVPPTSLGAALIYFTGNDIFNRSLRLLASKKGMRLNQHGLYRDVMRGKGRVKVTEGELVEGRSERRIFEILGVPWREVAERSC